MQSVLFGALLLVELYACAIEHEEAALELRQVQPHGQDELVLVELLHLVSRRGEADLVQVLGQPPSHRVCWLVGFREARDFVVCLNDSACLVWSTISA